MFLKSKKNKKTKILKTQIKKKNKNKKHYIQHYSDNIKFIFLNRKDKKGDSYKDYKQFIEYSSKISNDWDIKDIFINSGGNENDYISLMINKEYNSIIGVITAFLQDEKDTFQEFLDGDIPYPQMLLYISRVEIHPLYQNKGLCKNFLSYFLKQMIRLDYDYIFIDNESDTADGIPACKCYYKAGILNNFVLRYDDKKKPVVMDLDTCNKKNKLKTTYYYISLPEYINHNL